MVAIWLPLLVSAIGPMPETRTNIGHRVPEFSARDCRGQEHHLRDWRDRKLIVVVFLGVNCPLAKLYGPRLAVLARDYEARGVAVIGVHANPHEALTDLSHFIGEHHIPFPVLRDVGNNLVDAFGATRTPEAFILDEKRVIGYRGRIDDQYDVGLQRQTTSRHDLIEALDELLAGKPVSRPVTEAVGCRITREAPRGQGSVTYTKDVAPILQKRCQECHRPGEIAPFALTTYEDAAGNAATIREVVEQGRMPPWNANPQHGRFANDPSLTAAEKKALLAWIDDDCPKGEAADLPPPRRFADGWNIAQPDLVLSIPQPVTVPAEGLIEYQYFDVDPGFTTDRWVQAAEVRPGNRAVVHHCTIYLKAPGAKGPVEQGALGSFMLTGLAPGMPPMSLPLGMAKRIPAGWHIVFEVHYVAVGSEQIDQTTLGLKFADARSVRKEVATKVMYEMGLNIPPHDANYDVSQTWQINEDLLLVSLFPHMHLRGKSFRYEVISPDGAVEILLDVPHYDFNWQHIYVLAEPRRLPAGTRLRCSAVFDNSSANPANPDPSATVHTGGQSTDEMFNGYFDVVRADEDLTQPIAWHTALWANVRPFFPRYGYLTMACAAGFFFVRRRFGGPQTMPESSPSEPKT